MSDGIRFKRGGIAERALKALSTRPRDRDHHYHNARDDLIRAQHRHAAAKAEADDAARTAKLLPKAAGEALTERHQLLLALATRSLAICQQKFKTTVYDVDGRPVVPPGRAPAYLTGPLAVLEAEDRNRQRLAAADAAIAALPRNAKLPPLTAHDAINRLQWSYFWGSVEHQDRQEAMQCHQYVALPAPVEAFDCYLKHESAHNRIPVVTLIHADNVTVWHAIYSDRLPLTDTTTIANFVLHAGKRLHLHLEWSESEPTVFTVVGPTDNVVDYYRIIRRLRDSALKSPFDDDDHTPGDAGFVLDIGATAASTESASPTEPRPWTDPRPRLDTIDLPWRVVRLFKLVRQFDRQPPLALNKRTPGPAWYMTIHHRPDVDASTAARLPSWLAKPSGQYVDVEEVAYELAHAAITGDLDRAKWMHDHHLRLIDDQLYAHIAAKAAQMVEAAQP